MIPQNLGNLPDLPPFEDWPQEEGKVAIPVAYIDHYLPVLKASATKVFVALCARQWPTSGERRPSLAQLQEDTGLCRTTIVSALAELNTFGLLPENTPQSGSSVSETLRWEIWERDNYACRSCGSKRRLTIDHIHPRSKGGTDHPDNLQTLCRSCNSKKGGRSWQSS